MGINHDIIFVLSKNIGEIIEFITQYESGALRLYLWCNELLHLNIYNGNNKEPISDYESYSILLSAKLKSLIGIQNNCMS